MFIRIIAYRHYVYMYYCIQTLCLYVLLHTDIMFIRIIAYRHYVYTIIAYRHYVYTYYCIQTLCLYVLLHTDIMFIRIIAYRHYVYTYYCIQTLCLYALLHTQIRYVFRCNKFPSSAKHPLSKFHILWTVHCDIFCGPCIVIYSVDRAL